MTYEWSLIQNTVLTAKREARTERGAGGQSETWVSDILIQVFNDATCSFLSISSCAKHRFRCFWPKWNRVGSLPTTVYRISFFDHLHMPGIKQDILKL